MVVGRGLNEFINITNTVKNIKNVVMKNKLIIAIACFFSQQLAAQNVGIGTTTPDVSAQLDIVATNKGFN